MRNGSNFEFSLKKKNDNTLDTTTATMKMWGIKLDGIDASDISYNNETVESALDSLLVPESSLREALSKLLSVLNSALNKLSDLLTNFYYCWETIFYPNI